MKAVVVTLPKPHDDTGDTVMDAYEELGVNLAAPYFFNSSDSSDLFFFSFLLITIYCEPIITEENDTVRVSLFVDGA